MWFASSDFILVSIGMPRAVHVYLYAANRYGRTESRASGLKWLETWSVTSSSYLSNKRARSLRDDKSRERFFSLLFFQKLTRDTVRDALFYSFHMCKVSLGRCAESRNVQR